MSNCITLRNNEVFFSKEEIDMVKLRALLDSVPKEYDKARSIGGDIETAWWYLSENTVLDDNGAIITFGEGNSSHTWRDFRGLINSVLKPLMLKEKTHTFRAHDDGFPGWGSLIVVFGKDNTF